MLDQPNVPATPCSAVDPSEESLKQLAAQLDDGPFLMLNLLDFAPDGGREHFERYAAVASEAIRDRGGEVLYAGEPVAEAPPEVASDWDRVICVRYPSRATYLDLQQDAGYRAALSDRRAGLARRLLYVTRPGAPPGGPPDFRLPMNRVEPSSKNEVFVINLLRFRGTQGLADYVEYSKVVGPEIAKRGGGVALLLEGELPLVSDGFWHDILLVRYPAIESLTSMVSSEKWQAANAHRQRGLHETIAFPTRSVRL